MGRHRKIGHSRNSFWVALSFFVFWLIVMYLGADHPAPWGFIWIPIIDFMLSILVYRRSSLYFALLREGKKGSILIALKDGLLAGFALSGITSTIALLRDDVAYRNGATDVLAWMAVITALGAISSLGVYAICGLVTKLGRKKSAPT